VPPSPSSIACLNWQHVDSDHLGSRRSQWGQKYPKRLRLPAGQSTHEHMGRIVPGKDINGSHDRAPQASQSRVQFW
jgi:hypothetical protein